MTWKLNNNNLKILFNNKMNNQKKLVNIKNKFRFQKINYNNLNNKIT